MRPLRRTRAFRPFASGGGRAVAAILGTFALMFTLSVVLSIMATSRSRGRGAVVQVADRQRNLAAEYVEGVLLVREGRRDDPATIGGLMNASARVLLEGGTAPEAVNDNDETKLPAATSPELRAQLMQEQHLVNDLVATGAAILAHRPLASVTLTANEHPQTAEPILRLRDLAALTSNVSLNAARTIATEDDRNISNLTSMQVGLGVGGLLVSLLLAWGLIVTTRRRTAHFRSLVESSTDLVAVFGSGGCRYASRSFGLLTGRPEADLLKEGLLAFVHEDDRARVAGALEHGQSQELVLRVLNARGEWRHLEARLTDLRHDRHVRGIMLNARDTTERIALQHELAQQAERDKFGTQLVEALEMADEESSAFEVVQRAMTEIAAATPMELLLSDSSRAHLRTAAVSPTADPPGCPVESPFSCVAVRRGSPVVFETSEALNACPKLSDRASGPCSAACVPVGFMGRALGVLHVTGPDGKPPDADTVEKLATLATQAGARIGTVRAFERTQLHAATDVLTGVANRRATQGQMRMMMRSGEQFALVVADLDEFKRLNDKYGHEAGDRALRQFSQVCQTVLRDRDTIGRWGGEEFLFMLPGLDAHGAVPVLERLRERLVDTLPEGNPGFTVSFGATDSSEADTIEELLQIADEALYASKAAGRDCITVGSPSMDFSADATHRRSDPNGDYSNRDYSNGDTNGDFEVLPVRRVALHEAADEEEPEPNGADIR